LPFRQEKGGKCRTASNKFANPLILLNILHGSILGDINLKNQETSEAGHLQKRLGFAFALAIGIGGVIGAGIMRTTGPVVDQVPVIWIAVGLWVLGGLHVLLSANIASELATAIPKAGGLFVPVRIAFGDSMGLLAGWTYWLASIAAIAFLSIVCANFLAVIFPDLAPNMAAMAVCFCLALFGLNWIGVREGSLAQTTGSIIKLMFLCIIIGIAFFATPALTEAVQTPASGPASAAIPLTFLAIIGAYQLVYGAYAGWESCIIFVEEDKNASVNIPRAMAMAIVLITILYVALNVSLVRALDIEVIRNSDLPVADVLENVFGPIGGIVAATLGIVLAITCLNASVMSAPRVLYGLGRDGLFLHMATRVNKGGTPDVSFAITLIFSLFLIFSGGFEFIFRLSGALAIFCFILYEASLFALRLQQPDLPRPFRAIGYPYLPAFLLLLDICLLVAFIAADPVSGLYMLGLIAICIPVGIILHNRRRQHSLAADIAVS